MENETKEVSGFQHDSSVKPVECWDDVPASNGTLISDNQLKIKLYSLLEFSCILQVGRTMIK